jgi:GNAT superfamily N-acetyltransferase
MTSDNKTIEIDVRRPISADVAGLVAISSQWPTETGSHAPARMDHAGCCVLVASVDGRIVGYIYGYRQNGGARIEEVMVAPEHHRRGVGTRLVRAFEQWARETGCTFVTLGGVVPAFYEKLGYIRRIAASFTKNL